MELIHVALGARRSTYGAKAADMIALNAGAALYVAGITRDMRQGVALAEDAIHGGRAREKMAELAAFSHGLQERSGVHARSPSPPCLSGSCSATATMWPSARASSARR